MSTFRLNFVPSNLGLFGQRAVAKRNLDLDTNFHAWHVHQEGIINSSARLSDVSGHRDVTAKWSVRREDFRKWRCFRFLCCHLQNVFLPFGKRHWIYCYRIALHVRRYSKRRLVECYFIYNIKPRANGRNIVGHTSLRTGSLFGEKIARKGKGNGGDSL